jgi:hypothetical protein
VSTDPYAIRIAALDAAVHMITGGGRNLVNNDAMVTDAAEHFERWLTRPVPADVSTADRDEHTPPAGVYCDVVWRKANGAGPHQCVWSPGHNELQRHMCNCGDVLDASSVRR